MSSDGSLTVGCTVHRPHSADPIRLRAGAALVNDTEANEIRPARREMALGYSRPSNTRVASTPSTPAGGLAPSANQTHGTISRPFANGKRDTLFATSVLRFGQSRAVT